MDDTPVMEGYLEKHSTGVSRIRGKTKFWCTLVGRCLQYCKENKRSSVVEALLLGDAQMVRRTNNDRQGTQFEIVMKKQRTHVFSAATAEECSSWVKCLQAAMTQDGTITMSRSSFVSSMVQRLDAGYEEITISPDANPSMADPGSTLPPRVSQSSPDRQDSSETAATRTSGLSTCSSRHYAEITPDLVTGDASAPSASTPTVGEYEDVVEYRRSTRRESHKQNDDSMIFKKNSLYESDNLTQETTRQSQNTVSEDLANNYSTVDSCRTQVSGVRQLSLACDPEDTNENEPPHTYSKINKAKPRVSCEDDATAQNETREYEEGQAIERLDRELKSLPPPSLPPALFLLSSGDLDPLADLKDFLANNRHLCRSSSTLPADDTDPLQLMKEVLREIG